jgi:hypothetical protein
MMGFFIITQYLLINDSNFMKDKENSIIDRIVNFMLQDTNYKIKTIKGEPVVRIIYPFYGDKVYTEDWDGIDYHLNFMGSWGVGTDDYTYMNDQFGITNKNIIQEIFNKYSKILFTKLRDEIEGMMDENNLNESIGGNQKIFYDKIVDLLIKDTKINVKLQIILYPPINFYSSIMSLLQPSDAFYNEFKNYCNHNYGLTDEEFDYVWEIYSKKMFNEFKGGNSINESILNPKREEYLNKILEYLLSDTDITSSPKYGWVNISTPFTNLQYSRIRHFDRADFFQYCRDTYGLTMDESYSLWEDYSYEVDQILINEWGIRNPRYH